MKESISDYVKLMCLYFDINRQIKPSITKKHKVIFKLDDLSNLSKSVKKLDNIVQKERLKISWGIIGNSLITPHLDYLEFLINKKNGELYHFFNHGFSHAFPNYEFDGPSLIEQIESIRKTQQLMYSKTSIILDTFAAPCNHIDSNTTLALDEFNEIKYWYYGNESTTKKNFVRTIDIENGVGNPDFKFFKEQFDSIDAQPQVLILQAHPNAWKKIHFLNFKIIVAYLSLKHCEFIHPSDIF